MDNDEYIDGLARAEEAEIRQRDAAVDGEPPHVAQRDRRRLLGALDATRARLAEVERERDEARRNANDWADAVKYQAGRTIRAEAERDCAAGWAEENDRLGRRCNTLTATLREVRDLVAGKWTGFTKENILARCDAVLK